MKRALALTALLLAACPPPGSSDGSIVVTPDASTLSCDVSPCVEGARCIGGRCYAVACGFQPCDAGQVCDETRCVEEACAGVRCQYGSCSGGRCPLCSPLEIELDGGCSALQQPGASCTSGATCRSQVCIDGVCCDQPCDRPCERCDVNGHCQLRAPLDPGRTGAPCQLGRCRGDLPVCVDTCSSGTDLQCSGAAWCDAGQCVAALGVGAACTRDRQCTSGHCVDGWCCDGACGAPCETCAGRDGGLGPGRCGPEAPGVLETACGVTACSGVSAGCATQCAGDPFCATTHFCDGGCQLKRAPGAACTRGGECDSNLCRGGVCCTADCRGGCQTCLTDGRCDTPDAGPDDAGHCGAAAPDGGALPWCTPAGDCCSVPCLGTCQSCVSGQCGYTVGFACGAGFVCKPNAANCPNSCGGNGDCDRLHVCDMNLLICI